MDSLTQMVLGAAVGKAAMGKKLGNRAALWGGIAGTIPDLDVMANLFMDPLDALVFHRGITHSVVFSILASLIMGYLVPIIYKNPKHKFVAGGLWILLATLSCGGIFFLGGITILKSLISTLLLGVFIWIIYKKYSSSCYSTFNYATVKDWQWMFWWSFITHPILDCFTTYGTQILLPFSDTRVAFNNIAVADPIYTIVLIVFLVWALNTSIPVSRRLKLNNIGLIISSLYMVFTLVNKQYINHVFTKSLDEQGIHYSRYMTTPTIFNNVLWSGVAESDTSYFFGQYSWFDTEKKFEINEIAKKRNLVGSALDNDHTLKTLSWFSNGYFSLNTTNPDSLQWYDLRFGSFRLTTQSKDEFVFKFDLIKKGDAFIMDKQPTRPRDGDTGAMFRALWNRIKGI